MTKGSYYNNSKAFSYEAEHVIEDLNELLTISEQQQAHEAALREKNPALQEAWERYQILLRLATHE